MRVHSNQIDPNMQLNSAIAAARAEAKKEVERTRRKLLNAASALSGGYGDESDFAVILRGDSAFHEEHRQRNQQDSNDQSKQDEQESAVSDNGAFSGWV